MKQEFKDNPASNYQGTSLHDERPPDFAGEGGSVWRVPLVDPEKRGKVYQHALVGVWLIQAPDAHVFWEYYLVFVSHLRDIEGVPPPEKVRPDAEYQVSVFTLDPAHPLPLIEDLATGNESNEARRLAILHPPDFEAQFTSVNGDYVAYDLVDEMCAEVSRGRLSPDSDYRSTWARILMEKVAQKIGSMADQKKKVN